MTSGGTESIVSALHASIVYAKETKGITAPEIVVANTAHPAAHKAARYTGAECVSSLPS
jgi:sphinganine-1-phosphate aldolase